MRLLLGIGGLLLAPIALFAQENVSFKLNGQAITPVVHSREGKPEQPQAGVVVAIGDFLLTLGPEKVCEFRSDKDQPQVLLQVKEGAAEVVAVRVEQTYRKDKRIA